MITVIREFCIETLDDEENLIETYPVIMVKEDKTERTYAIINDFGKIEWFAENYINNNKHINGKRRFQFSEN